MSVTSAALAVSTVSDVPTAGEESYFTVFAGGEAFGNGTAQAIQRRRVGGFGPCQ